MIGEKEEYKDKIKRFTYKYFFDYIKIIHLLLLKKILDYVSKNKILGVYSLNDSKLDYSNEIQFQKVKTTNPKS